MESNEGIRNMVHFHRLNMILSEETESMAGIAIQEIISICLSAQVSKLQV